MFSNWIDYETEKQKGKWKTLTIKAKWCPAGLVMTVVQINGKLPWKCFRLNTGSWIAVCDVLKVTVEAETWALLMKDIDESINTIFNDLFESDQLDQFLRQHGWTWVDVLPSTPEYIHFDIPFLPSIADPKKYYRKGLRSLIKSALFTDGWRKFKFPPASRPLPRKQTKRGQAFQVEPLLP